MELTDTELRERLLEFGYAAPPITNTSRRILLKKLKALETDGIVKSSHESEPDKDNDSLDGGDDQPSDYGSVSSPRYRCQKSNFIPENVGMYTRCFARYIDFWDRIGFFKTAFILALASVILFFGFKTVVDWNDRRFRSVDLPDPVFPKCGHDETTGMTCVPNSEIRFTLDNLNTIRYVIHEATINDRCSRSSYKNNDFVGMFPLFNDSEVVNLLIRNNYFKEFEAKNLLQNAKILFKANPAYEMKWLNGGILYRNHRLLRTCSYMGLNDSIIRVVAYAVASITLVLFTYKTHRWVNRIRGGGDQERRRLIKDIADLLKQNQKSTDSNFVSVQQVREWILSAVDVKQELWDEVLAYLREHHAGIIVIEKRNVRGQNCDVFRLQN